LYIDVIEFALFTSPTY